MIYHNTDFPLSIEEFAAYLDGNLTPEEMERLSALIEGNETMQEIMAGLEQCDETFAEQAAEGIVLPVELATLDFDIPDIGHDPFVSPGFVAACASPIVPLFGSSSRLSHYSSMPCFCCAEEGQSPSEDEKSITPEDSEENSGLFDFDKENDSNEI